MKHVWLILVAIGFILSIPSAHARGGGTTSYCLSASLQVGDAVDQGSCVLNDGTGVLLANGSVLNCGARAVDVRANLLVSTDGGYLYHVVATEYRRRLAPGETWQALDLQIPIPAGYPPTTLLYIFVANVNRTSYNALSSQVSVNVSESCP